MLIANAELGHIGTFYQKYGGKTGKAAVALLKWRFKGDLKAKELFCSPAADSEIIKMGFDIRSKNGFC